jgi:hypothetical protein
MFQKARKELHKHLKKYMFSLVTRAVTVPADCVLEGGEVSHYYTTTDELIVGSAKKNGSVWIKKKSRARQHQLGPVLLASSNSLPKPGDIVFGEAVKGPEHKFGRQSFKEERHSFKWWICPGAPLYYLATMVLKGTSETEDSLRQLLKLQGDFDDLWMLARVVLFNNVKCFVDLLDPQFQAKQSIKLREPPAVFIQQVAVWLDDFSVITEFQRLQALSPTNTASSIPSLAQVTSFPEGAGATTANTTLGPQRKFIGRKRPFVTEEYKTEYHPEEYNPDDTQFDFSHRRPAGVTSAPGPSKRYDPVTPPYVPASPPYVPASPPYVPTSPPYAPFTPPHL